MRKAHFVSIQDATNQKQWDKFITSHPETNFLQSWDFYEFHKARGKQVVRRTITEGNKIIAAYAGVIETARRGKHLAIAGGPVLDWSHPNLADAIFADMAEQGIKHGCVFVRVRPQLESDDPACVVFRNFGFKKAPMYLSVEYAGVLDLTKSEDELLKNMRQRLRRALRKAEKNHIIVEKSTNPKDIKTFYKIQNETAKRHDFVEFSEDFLEEQFAAFAPHKEAVLYTAKTKDGEILAQNFMIFYGNEASYHYGASTELGTKLSGAPLLHLTAMRDAKERGIERYNLWGIVAEDDTKHRFYGVSVFKRGFGVDELKSLPAQDLVLKPAAYAKTWLVETLRRHHRHV